MNTVRTPKTLARKASLVFAALLFLAGGLLSAEDTFNPLDTVRLGPTDGAEYDVFVIGDGSQSYTAKRWITPFLMNRYETTYALWYIVRLDGEKRGYHFSHPGQEGSMGKRGAPPTTLGLHQPVTMISWYDAVIWCNAYSEYCNLTPCYTYKGEILRDSEDTAKIDLAECNWKAKGWRLPTEAEWEYAARKTKSGYQSGGTMSGQVDKDGFNDPTIPEDEVSWTASNAKGTHLVGTAGTPFTDDAPPAAGSGNPNGSGLFDMSGNVLEFCWDWYGTYIDIEPGLRAIGAEYGHQRVSRGGSWSEYTPFACTGDRYKYDPNEYYNFMGFRICRTAR